MHNSSHPEYREGDDQGPEQKPSDPSTPPPTPPLTGVPPEGQAQGPEATNAKRFWIPGDEVNRATADLPDQQRSAIRWLHAYASEHDLGLTDLGKLVRLSNTTLSLVFRGKYEAKLDGVVDAIISFRTLMEKRSTGKKLNFIPTELTDQVWSACAAALEFQRMVCIWGDSQIGKSIALIAYQQAHNHGETIYLRMPTPCSMSNFLSELAESLRINPQQPVKELRRRILSSFDDRMLLIVDEAHQAMFNKRRGNHPLEFLRELHDRKNCGVVLCGTNVFRDEMERGYLADIMRQTKRRRLISLQLPDRPSRACLNTFSAAYGLPPASGAARKLEHEVIQEEALGMWLALLRMGTKTAGQRKEAFNWSHVLAAHSALRLLEGGQTGNPS